MDPHVRDLLDIGVIFSKRLTLAVLCMCALLSGRSTAIETPPPLNIGAPLDSLNRSELRDSFNEIHNGHRHAAIDIMRPRGTPVRAVTDGSVRKLFASRQGGLTIYEFDGAGTYCYYYAHLDHYAVGLREGMPVSRGDVIGYVGTSGNASLSAPQLHFAIYRLGPDKTWWKGEPIDPYPILLRAITVPSQSGFFRTSDGCTASTLSLER
jgi:murein DD-endopeptidase MepM/ murein hydrolase activator NlpD